jgi:Stress responsive A/B Barrel Domain
VAGRTFVATPREGIAVVIQHIVLLKWKPETTQRQIEEAVGQAQALVDEIASVERITFGRNRGDDAHGFTHALIVRLSDAGALESYLGDPARRRYVDEVLGPIEAERIEIDVPEDAHLERHSELGWDWARTTRPSASAAAAALRWEEKHAEP